MMRKQYSIIFCSFMQHAKFVARAMVKGPSQFGLKKRRTT